MTTPAAVLDFWFPQGLARDDDTHRRQFLWWFRGGADPEILARFRPTLEAACRGQLAAWAGTARGRLALVIVLDQFSRTIFRGSARAFSQDETAGRLVLEALANGDYQRLAHVWEKTFLVVPLGHSEEIALHDRAVALAKALADEAPPHLRKLYEHSLSQARGHREVIARFGRHPHRNQVLGRVSTPEEREYLATATLVHERSPPE